MKRFASIDMFFDFSDWNYRMGRPVANEGFLKALLSHSHFDTFHFFCPDIYHCKKFEERLKTRISDGHLHNRIKISLQTDLANSIVSNKYSNFHLGDFTHFMPYLVDIRNRFAKYPFAISGITHSLDGVFLNLRYLELILSGLKGYDGIICSSNAAKTVVKKGMTFVADQLKSFSEKDIQMPVQMKQIPLGIEDDFFIDHDKQAAREFLKIPKNVTVGLSVGRLSIRQKSDWSPILGLLSRMYSNKELENTIYIIAGGADNEEVSLLDSIIKHFGLEQKVVLFPNFPADVKTKLYAAADFYVSVVDNFQETFGLNVIEAKASGLPVIASDFSGYRELVHHQKDGVLIPTYWSEDIPAFIQKNIGILNPSLAKMHLSQTVAVDLQELQDAILLLANEEKLRMKMGENAKKDAQNFRWENIIRQYETFWENLTDEIEVENNHRKQLSHSLLSGNFSQTFSHFPTKRLNDSDLISITDVGLQVIHEKLELIKYDEITNHLSEKLEKNILHCLQKEAKSISQVKFQTKKDSHFSDSQFNFQLQWMLKHGEIQLQSN